MNKKIKMKRKINPHGKPGDVSAKLNFNSDSKFGMQPMTNFNIFL